MTTKKLKFELLVKILASMSITLLYHPLKYNKAVGINDIQNEQIIQF